MVRARVFDHQIKKQKDSPTVASEPRHSKCHRPVLSLSQPAHGSLLGTSNVERAGGVESGQVNSAFERGNLAK
jgi:hypothetical protein